MNKNTHAHIHSTHRNTLVNLSSRRKDTNSKYDVEEKELQLTNSTMRFTTPEENEPKYEEVKCNLLIIYLVFH